MGKTGSTAIARAVQDATGDRVFQIFRLEAARLAQAEQRYRVNNREARRRGSEPGALPFPGALHLWESEYLLAHPPAPGAPWTVVTTVREPIGQAVSAFFHGGGLHGGGTRGRARRAVDRRVARVAHRRAGAPSDWIRPPLRWFDREFAPALGIDVFAHAFDHRAGPRGDRDAGGRVLLLRQENLDAAPAALAGFLGRAAPVPVPARNQASTKAYGPRYQEFLASVRFPDAVLDEVYGSRYATHFYADTELQRFRDRWLNRRWGRTVGWFWRVTRRWLRCAAEGGCWDGRFGQGGRPGGQKPPVSAPRPQMPIGGMVRDPREIKTNPSLTKFLRERLSAAFVGSLVAIGVLRPRTATGELGPRSWKGLFTFLISVFAIVFVWTSVHIVQPGTVAVPVTWGHPGKPLDAGVHLTRPFTTAYSMSTRTQNYTMSSVANQGPKGNTDTAVAVLGNDGGAATVNATVLYRLDPSKATDVFRVLGTGYATAIVRPGAQLRAPVFTRFDRGRRRPRPGTTSRPTSASA